ncbi:MAG: hypothetical protein ACJ8AT_13720 [Hyalangium sp.]|uniref:hypothetical protein n=1 Tax=Hyalangium sp. TaxID=2028555 RepID=UPI00389A8BE6
MISPDYPLASWFLVVATFFFMVVVALPLLFVPLTWARWFRWKLPEGGTDLTVYFGRCLGGVALAMLIAIAHAIPDPKGYYRLFDLVTLTCGLMVLIHLYGAVRKIQPLSETLEIAVWALVCGLSMWIRFSVLA